MPGIHVLSPESVKCILLYVPYIQLILELQIVKLASKNGVGNDYVHDF